MSIWISRLDVRGFQRLAGTFPFERGVNVVHGENEAGKSTLHELLLRILYGFSKAEQTRYGGVSGKDRSRPWSGAGFGASARLARIGGTSDALLLDWDFEAHGFTLSDALTGAPLGSGGKLPGEHLLDLLRVDFEQVCCLRQEDILAVSGSGTLQAGLQAAVATSGAARVAVDDAEARLVGVLKLIGARVDTYNATPAGELGRLRADRNAIAAELERCRAGRAELAGLSQEAEKASAAADAAHRQALALEQATLLAEQEALKAEAEEVTRLGREAGSGPKEAPALTAEVEARIAEIRGSLERAELVLREQERAAAGVEDAVAAAALQEQEARARVQALALWDGIDVSAEEEVRALELRLRDAEQEAREEPPAAPAPDPQLAAFRTARERLLRELESPRRPPLVVVLLTLGIALFLHRRRQARHEAHVAEVLAGYGGGTLEELDARLRAEDDERLRREALAEAQRTRVAEAAAQAGAAHERLVGVLDRAGAAPGADAVARAAAYLHACAGRRELDRAQVKQLEAERRLTAAREPLRALDEAKRARDGLRIRLDGELSRLGLDTTDERVADEAYGRLQAEAKAVNESIAAARSAAQQLHGKLGGESPEALAQRARDAQERAAQHVRRHGPLAGTVVRGGDLAERAAVARQEAHAKRLEAERLDTERSVMERELASPAELEEQLARAEATLARVELVKDAVRIAREELAAAAAETYRAFAPHLKERLAQTLPRITRGRYAEALVDDSLSIRVVAPETGSLVPVEQLSRGTRDQIFLVQRLEIARLLHDSAATAPLLLDDPFAHFDVRRQRAALRLLGEIGLERQVFLFTEDERVAELAREELAKVAVTALAPPPAHD